MNLKHYLCSPNLGLFLIRLSLAVVFIAHGVDKLSNIENTIGFFASLGLGAFFAWLVAIVEVLAGVSMLLGICTGTAGLAIAVIMLVAIVMVKAKMGIRSAEFEFVLLMAGLGIATAGPGAWALPWCKGGCNCKDGHCNVHGTDATFSPKI